MKKLDLESSPRITDGFKTPENYFGELHENILIRSQNESRIVPLWKRPVIVAAAAVLIVALAVVSIWPLHKVVEPDIHTVENYLASQLSVYDEELLAAFDQEDIDILRNDIEFDMASAETILSENPDLEYYILLQ